MATMLDPYSPDEQQQGTQQGGGGFASIPGLDSHLSDDPLLAGQQMKQASYGAELQRQQLEAQRGQQALQLGQLENERAQRAARLENQAQAVQTAGSDIAQWAHDPAYRGQSWNDVSTAHPEVYAHAVQAYPDIIHQIPGLWNEAQRTETGNPELGYPQPPTGTPKNVSIGLHGTTENYMTEQGQVNGQSPPPLPSIEFPSTQQNTAADESNPYLAQYRQAAEDASASNPINQLPDTEKIPAQMIASYRMPVQQFQRMQSKYPGQYMRILEAVQAINPNFDEKQYQGRQKTLSSFASGQDANNRTSMNTAIGHLGALMESADALSNKGNQLWNLAGNKIQEVSGNPAQTKFLTERDALASEMAKVFKGTGAATNQEIEEWRKNLSPNLSPEQMKANATAMIDLMGSRLDALKDKYENGMGEPMRTPILSPKSMAILRKNGLPVPGQEPQAGQPQPPQAQGQPAPLTQGAAAFGQGQPPPNIQTKDQYDALPSGSSFIGFDGKRYNKP